ncbi:MAG: hypothetical protein HYY23_03340 [Verrucomicrobia bacterium]|nr:hypothetical protein [Verrucomicrobiota bacterium]
MSTVQEIKAAIPNLTPTELAELKEWLEEFFEDQCDLSDQIKADLEEAKRDIREGRYRIRQTP